MENFGTIVPRLKNTIKRITIGNKTIFNFLLDLNHINFDI